MSGSMGSSRARVLAGVILLAVAGLMATFVLPDAAQQKARKQKASEEAKRALSIEMDRLARFEEVDQRFSLNQARLDTLLNAMPDQGIGQLQWELSRRLNDLARQHMVRLQSLKYGAPTRDESKGTGLEVLHVEFTATGVYQNLKPFMLGLEDRKESRLPFAVASAKLEESPDGARLSIILRAFRRSEAGRDSSGKGGA